MHSTNKKRYKLKIIKTLTHKIKSQTKSNYIIKRICIEENHNDLVGCYLCASVYNIVNLNIVRITVIRGKWILVYYFYLDEIIFYCLPYLKFVIMLSHMELKTT